MAPPTKVKSKAAKPSVKPGKLPTGAARDAQAAKDKQLATQIVARRKNEEGYAAIASDLNVTVGKAIYLYECATTAPKDKIRWTNEDDRASKIVAARQAGLSWGLISARTDPRVPEGTVRKVWEDTTGKSAKGENIGKGGRGVVGAPSRAKAKVAPKAKAKATPKAAAGNGKATAKPKAAAPGVKRVIKRRVAAS